HEGLSASPGKYVLKIEGNTRIFETKISRLDFPEGAVFTVHTAGGGGYGHPYEREPERVLEDFKDDLVSRKHALEVYGVVIDETGQLNLDATAKKRKSEDIYENIKLARIINTDKYGPDRTILVSQQLAKKMTLINGDLVEVTNGIMPLRGWIRVDEEFKENHIGLPELFIRVFKIKEGDLLKLRSLSGK
ncbi:MAG: hypothetical protein KAJ15_08455, partial [Spirochaetes bacterium]|nr:hypothetical protein [Spirochaetota bacterium]